ncbi:Major facilitator super domain-containing protein 12 [Desmophyllum pertusum]|uniref:Major facilitator super domain-containing protein 12 n=1 Tax=Desmophyllum pertusum TaxID=174260 RepID=A0A9X0CXE5_9CNID|nr:Major facilitator super domain-containing protein 12 [Desmophyllum pertusum]
MDFTVTILIVIGIGLVFAAIFHIGTNEPLHSSAELSTAVVATKCVRKSHFGPDELQTDKQGKEKMRDRFIADRLELKDEPNDSRATELKVSLASQSRTENGGVLYKDFEACSLTPNESLDVNSNTAKSRPRSPDEITVAHVDGVGSKSLEIDSDPESAFPPTPGSKTVREWLKDPHLYKIAIIYACTRVLQDVSYSYLPLLLTDRLKFQKEAIANLPLIVLISATVSTVISKKLAAKIGSKWSFILAALLVIGSCVWFYSITQSTRVLTYPAAALLGFGFSAMFVNAISFATELIGDNKNTSGLVFSFICTTASLIEGTMFITIQNFFPKESVSGVCEECGDYVRHVFSLVPGSLAAISLLIVLMFQASPTTLKRKTLQTDAIENKEGTVETL